MDTSLPIIIDEEFRELLPALDPETYRLLEENILEYGVREPLVLWKIAEADDTSAILIDGHNRYKICCEHNIPFNTTFMEFENREEAIIWIINLQIMRRNLNTMQLSYFRGRHYRADKKSHGDISRVALKNAKGQIDLLLTGSTANRLAAHYKVSDKTIKRDFRLAEAIDAIGETSPEARQKILSHEIPVNRSKLETLSLDSKEEIEAFAAAIQEDTYVKRTQRTPNQANINALLPEMKKLNSIIRDFQSSFNSLIIKFSTDETTDMKPVLRSYIDQLEDLYENMQ